MNNITPNKSRWFQWVKGDNAGKVVEWSGEIINDEHIGANFLIFKDNSRANEELLNDWIVEIAAPNDLILQNEFEKPKAPVKENKVAAAVHDSSDVNKESISLESPIHRVLEDSKKTKTVINISILVDTPPSNLMSVLAETYLDGENQVLDYIANTLNLDDVKHQIARQVWLSAFDSKPNKNTKKTKTNEIKEYEV